jgi:hypothetical protein
MAQPSVEEGTPKVDLPDGMVDWIAAVGDGRVTRLERHVARREAWVVDVTL